MGERTATRFPGRQKGCRFPPIRWSLLEAGHRFRRAAPLRGESPGPLIWLRAAIGALYPNLASGPCMKNFVVNLNRQPEKFESFLRLNAGTGIAFERFEASDGASFSPEEALGMNLVVPGSQFTAGAVGCAASHVRIWQQTIQSGIPALVFEDDAIVRHDITERLDVVRRLEDWDYVALGYNTDSTLEVELTPGFRSAMVFSPKQPTDQNAAAFQTSTSEVTALRLSSCFGTAGYVVSPRGAKKLLELCLPMENRFLKLPVFNRMVPVLGVDGMMNFIYQSIEAFACLSPLVIPRNNNAVSTTVPTGEIPRW
ncbi:glycosyltransferase family 25 protein [Bradyrhizobium sp. GCM10027634]|uniref:glycosyltransferase family 25 protein n=1 Tax=unclassified Bradyrhizobium TaxID=2631580 RepID=UPI00188C2399|nr:MULTISPECIES: glycosyltransferase family 25 protein [unclassified Bradyrhizobium]MDN5002303.1 glycosyltransferase family 25 protein [Bradyrhizobium sp. WYCCWR 12677]